MHFRIILVPLLLAFAVAPPKVRAVSPAGKIFNIAGSPPMSAIVMNTLAPSNSTHTKFRGGAQLQLTESSALALVAKLVIRNTSGRYAFKSAGSGFPRFKGAITTTGEPEVPRSVVFTLARGKNDQVNDRTSGSVTVAPSPTPSTSPFSGQFTGTFSAISGRRGLRGQTTLFIGADGVAGESFQTSTGATGGLRGVADMVTGTVTLTQLSEPLTSRIAVSVQLEVNSSVTGSGTLTTSNKHGTGHGTISITSREDITSSYVGVYLGTLNITSGPDGSSDWPVELSVANDGTAAGTTFDHDGNGFTFQGTVNLASGAFTLPVTVGYKHLTGITGNLIGNFVMPALANGTFNLSNGDTGTISLPKVAP